MADVRIGDASPRFLARLRVHLDDAAAVAAALGLSTEPSSVSGTDPMALWLGPEQWLLVSSRLDALAMAEDCSRVLGPILHLVTDAKDALHCLSIDGAGARMLLAMGSGVDFDEQAFPAGRCVRTRIAKIAAVIHSIDRDAFELYVDRSVGHYIGEWLSRAARDPLLRKA
jgi:heterotetrameric sarcosine oxidase gamma subunit